MLTGLLGESVSTHGEQKPEILKFQQEEDGLQAGAAVSDPQICQRIFGQK
jgi:hypothetical protein